LDRRNNPYKVSILEAFENQTMQLYRQLKEAILESEANGLISDKSEILTGFSGEKLTGTLQRFSKLLLNKDTCYLEVGVYRGLTLLSVAKEIGENKAFGVDNFAFFDKDGKNFGIVKERIAKLNLTNVEVINKDYEDALENLKNELGGRKVGVFFVDGPHDYRSQLMCLLLIKPFLADNAVILVDDSNYQHVRQANRDFLISHPEYKLFYESYTNHHPLNAHGNERIAFEKGWWNGINILVKDPENQLETMYPATHRDRSLYENEHAIHATKHPEVVPFLLKLTNAFAPIVYGFSKLKNKPKVLKGRFTEMNTYSEGLTSGSFNEGVQ
jgi:tRNA G46 methylase TrmB